MAAGHREIEGDGFIAWSERPGEVIVKLKGLREGERVSGRPYTGPVNLSFINDVFDQATKNDGGRAKPRAGGG